MLLKSVDYKYTFTDDYVYIDITKQQLWRSLFKNNVGKGQVSNDSHNNNSCESIHQPAHAVQQGQAQVLSEQ